MLLLFDRVVSIVQFLDDSQLLSQLDLETNLLKITRSAILQSLLVKDLVLKQLKLRTISNCQSNCSCL